MASAPASSKAADDRRAALAAGKKQRRVAVDAGSSARRLAPATISICASSTSPFERGPVQRGHAVALRGIDVGALLQQRREPPRAFLCIAASATTGVPCAERPAVSRGPDDANRAALVRRFIARFPEL